MSNLETIVKLMGQAADLQAKAAALLNCKVGDIGKQTALLMEAEGRQTVTITHAGRTYSATYNKGSADTTQMDSEAVKKYFAEHNIEVPTKPRKGKAATATFK